MYIGSTMNFNKRWESHRRTLTQNSSRVNSHLYYAWHKYGAENFEFKILEIVEDKQKLIEREQFYIDKYEVVNNKKGYNILPFASSRLGKQHDKYVKEKISASSIKMWKDPEHRERATISRNKPECKYKQSEARKRWWREKGYQSKKTILKESEVYEIMQLLLDGNTQQSIADIYGVTRPTISAIATRRTWKHLDDLLCYKSEV